MNKVDNYFLENEPINYLVYRMPQKSAVDSSCVSEMVRSAANVNNQSRIINLESFISIRPNSIVKYQRNTAPNTKDYTIDYINAGAKVNEDGTLDMSTVVKSLLPSSNKHNGLISKKANREVNKVIDWFLHIAKDKWTYNPKYSSWFSFKLNFVTLSLPSRQRHGDAELQKKLFSPFLDWVRKTSFQNGLESKSKSKCSMYFWRSESQANGSIHWHLCTDIFIPYWQIQDKWNYLTEKLDYISEFKKNNPDSKYANSTDVHSIRKVKNIAKYLSKYCGKNSKGITILLTKTKDVKPINLIGYKWILPPKNAKFYRQIYSRLWGCSENLSKVKKMILKVDNAIGLEMVKLSNAKNVSIFDFDYCRMFKLKDTSFVKLELNLIASKVNTHIQSCFSSS